MIYETLQIKDCLFNDDLERHLKRGGKDTVRMYPCIDTIYYHLEVNLEDYIIFRNKFILDLNYQNDSRFELNKTYGDLTTKEFVYFTIHEKFMGGGEERSDEQGGQTLRERYENELSLAQIGFNNPDIKNGREMIYIQMNSKSIHYRGAMETDKIIRNILLDYGIRIQNSKITRIDYSAIISGYDFSYLKSTLFKRRSPKSSYIESNTLDTTDLNFDNSTNELQNRIYNPRDELETLYLGARDYLVLRIYNKMKEMDKKVDIMKDIILSHRLGYEFKSDIDTLWTIEFECHRDFLKKYNILTMEDAYKSSVSMFKDLMLNKFVLLVKDKTKRNSHRIPVSKLWQKIAEYYKIDNVQQIELQKLKQKTFEITDFTLLRTLERFENCDTLSPDVRAHVETCIRHITYDLFMNKPYNN